MFKHLLKLIIHCSIVLTITICNVALADTSATNVGRYLEVADQPLAVQSDLLMQTFQIRFPSSIHSIGDALNYLLASSGYKLANPIILPIEVQNLLPLPLPQVDRNFGPMTLQAGLLTLAGKPFGLLVDPAHHLLSFRLLKEYQSLYQIPRSQL